MPYYDYTNKKKLNVATEQSRDQSVPQTTTQFIRVPKSTTDNKQNSITIERVTDSPIQRPSEFLVAKPATPQYVLTHPAASLVQQVEYANAGANTEDVKTSFASTMVDKDLIKMVNRGMNTDLVKDKVVVKEPKAKVNHYNEGFRTYYDDEADVLGVDCFMCCNNCWKKCNNICRGCRNAVSCPLYCWICFIGPVFIILIIGIAIGLLIWTQQIPTVTG